MINTTAKCVCGREKSKHHQFCAICWDAAPEMLKAKFESAMVSIKSAITAIRIASK